ncbi:MAG: hypothetical protein EOM65_10180 [Synergistales bacterium]|nr:hypothetical protein [Synergistales bacterium]
MYVPSQYTALFSEAWIWKEWLERGSLGYRLRDTGIDVLAKIREEEGFCVVQCRFQQTRIASCFSLDQPRHQLVRPFNSVTGPGFEVLPDAFLYEFDCQCRVGIQGVKEDIHHNWNVFRRQGQCGRPP